MDRPPRRVTIVPHTHWDREWYSPFQTFRLRLVDLLDELLPRLEADPSYAHFLLDGQMAVVDDYLAVRPDQEERLRHLALSGRLAMGPWYILMDEFLVSGETIVRDLAKGLDRAASFGGAMDVGYLPDMFGHIAQMPQILRQFGFEHAVVWRGVPSVIGRAAFWWEAPDGSTVRAEYLPEGYGNGSVLPMEGKELVARIDAFVERYGPMLADAEGEPDPILWMNGTDHQVPMPWLGYVVDEANREQGDYELRVGSLAEHLAAAPTDGLPTWRGELRSGAHSNLLMGVASNRTDVRRAAATAERALEARCEPLWALFQPADRWPATLLDEAWTHVVHNAAHDSICACSVDEVCNAVLHRYAEAVDIADGLAKRAADRFAMTLAHEGTVVVNPSARTRGGLAAVVVPGTDDVPGTQVLRRWAADGLLGSFPRDEALHMAPRAVDELGAHQYSIEATDEGALVVLTVDDAMRVPASFPTHDLEALLADKGDDARVEIRVRQAAKQQLLAHVADVPGYGWQAVARPTPPAHPVSCPDAHTLTNGLVTVVVDAVDGTFSVDGHAGLGRLVDGGDVGDTYNYCPPATDREVDTPDAVNVTVVEEGPVRATVDVVRTYRWPAAAVGLDARTDDEVTTEVTTRLELHAGEAFVRATTTFDNATRDHRLRAWFPLPERATSSRAECAFAMVERGLVAEGGDSERALPTFPSRRFVQAGGLTIAHEGLLEYELVDLDDAGATAGAVALTLLRCTGMLSQGPMPYRPLPAGPQTPMEGSQQRGPQTMRYAVAIGDVDAYALADDAFLPFLTGRARGVGEGPDVGTHLDVTGAPVSSLRRHDGRLELRVFNPGTTETEVRVTGRKGWLMDLKGTPLAPFEETIDLPAGRIATLALDES
ncbi:MAG: hypothetical protein JNK12_13685 [Acidimicrobiales bacterium]|nr:hypothetical protein [Acidimicrobiales bacterium]